MNPRGLFHDFNRNTNRSYNVRSSHSEANNEIIESFAEQIAAISIREESNQTAAAAAPPPAAAAPPPAAAPAPPAAPPPLFREVFTMKKQLPKMVEAFENQSILPDIVAEIIVENKLNIMIIDLYDFDKGFDVSFLKFGEEEEMFHGEFSYGMGLLDYIKDGEIPYEILDNLHNYGFQIVYDGYVMCQLRSHFDVDDSISSHFVFLKQSIQTIDGEVAMKCKVDDSLDDDDVRADLISHYSPEICLDSAAASSPSFGLNNWRQHPFITPYLKHIIMAEKTRYERGAAKKKSQHRPVLREEWEDELEVEMEKLKASFDSLEQWDLRSSNLEGEELSAEFESISDKTTKYESSLPSYLNSRKMCFPGQEHLTDKGRLHKNVEIENFVYEFTICTKAGNTESIQRKLRISVVDPREYYYTCIENSEDSEATPVIWNLIGGREALDTYIIRITKEFEKMKQSSSEMVITHNRFFDEQVGVSDGRVKIISKKLELPVSEVISGIPSPTQHPNENGFQDE